MPNYAGFLLKLYQRLVAISPQGARNIAMYGAREFSVATIREFDVTVKGVRYAYKDWSEADQKAVDVIVKCVHRFADQYAQHHAEYQQQRSKYHSFEDYLESHLQEIADAAVAAAMAHARSELYDKMFGKPKFGDQVFAKEYSAALIDDLAARIKGK